MAAQGKQGEAAGLREQAGARKAARAARSRRPGAGRPSGLRFSLWALLGLVVLVIDQATKFWFERHLDPGDVLAVLPGFNLVLAHNYGAAFSLLAQMGGWQRWALSGFALLVVVLATRLLWRHGERRLFSLALTLIVAGALGNLLDRMTSGYVIDFLDFYWRSWHWPAFNVADIAICAGAAGIVIDELLGVSGEKRK